MTTYRVSLTPATSFKYSEGWYFDNRPGEIRYEGEDLQAAKAAYNAIDMGAEAKAHNTAVERELAVLDESGLPETYTEANIDWYDIEEGRSAWWLVLTRRHRQLSSRDQRLYGVDVEKSPYYVAAYQADNGFAREILRVCESEEEMRNEVEERGIMDYMSDDDRELIGMNI